MQKTLLVLTGPTGIGKTRTGISLAKYYNTEIVSADSRQIFKELIIGSAVPSENELIAIKHHLIHSHSITENYNASRYETEALNKINTIFKTNEIALLVGGSMMYIDAVCKGIDEMPDADPLIRSELKSRLEREGLESLRLQLKQIDPDYYASVDLKNPNRIIHAIEISLLTGKPYSSFRSNLKKTRPFNIIKIGLNCERELLHQFINQRVDKMISLGLESEARFLYNLKHLNAMNTVGYKEFFDYFDGKTTRVQAIELIKRNSRRYARKQITWFRSDENIKWFEPGQDKEIITYIDSKLKKHE